MLSFAKLATTIVLFLHVGLELGKSKLPRAKAARGKRDLPEHLLLFRVAMKQRDAGKSVSFAPFRNFVRHWSGCMPKYVEVAKASSGVRKLGIRIYAIRRDPSRQMKLSPGNRGIQCDRDDF